MLEIAPAVDGGVAARPRRRSRSHCIVFGVPTVAELREAERRFLADNFDLGFAGGALPPCTGGRPRPPVYFNPAVRFQGVGGCWKSPTRKLVSYSAPQTKN